MSPHVRRMMKGGRRMSPCSRRTELRRPWRRKANLGQGWVTHPCRLGSSMDCPHPGCLSRRKPNPLRRIRRSLRNPTWETHQKSSDGLGKSRLQNPRRSLATLPIRAGRQYCRLLMLRHHRLPVSHIGRGRGPCPATSAKLFHIEVNHVGSER